MAEVVLTEIIEDMDLDRDGEVSLEEYLAQGCHEYSNYSNYSNNKL